MIGPCQSASLIVSWRVGLEETLTIKRLSTIHEANLLPYLGMYLKNATSTSYLDQEGLFSALRMPRYVPRWVVPVDDTLLLRTEYIRISPVFFMSLPNPTAASHLPNLPNLPNLPRWRSLRKPLRTMQQEGL